MSNHDEQNERALRLRNQYTPAKTNEALFIDNFTAHIEDEDKQPHVRDYIDVILRRKWVVLVFLMSVFTTVLIVTMFMTPLYKAKTTIQIKNTNPKLPFDSVFQSEGNDFYETQYKILKSRNLAERVVEKSENKLSLGEFMAGLVVEPVKSSQLVNISYVAENPELSARIANSVAEEYMNFTRESKVAPTMESRDRMEKEIESMRVKMEESENRLNVFLSENPNLIVDTDTKFENLLTQKLSRLTNELDKATADRITKEALYSEVRKAGVDYDFVLKNSIIQSLTMDKIKKEHEYATLLRVHKPEYPKMIQLKGEIEEIKDRIKAEEKKAVNTLESDYKIALETERYLLVNIGKLRKELTAFQDKMISFQGIRREVETNNEIYKSLLQRLKEIGVSTALAESNVQILDKAVVPKQPFKPDKSFNIALSLFFGLFGGVFLAFVIEYFDNTVKTGNDIEKVAGLPVLGSIPIAKSDTDKLISFHSDENVAFSEAFRSISTCLQFSNALNPPKHLLVTSPLEREGKTIMSVSIAMKLISSREKGIVIDADMRRPDVHLMFNLDNKAGLSSFLAGISGFEGLVQKSPYAGLDVITSGPKPPNPSELLNSSRMRELIDALSAEYDHIIIDSPPVLGMSDSLILSTFTDGVILVVRSGKTPGDALKQTTKALKSVNAKILGTVLNGVDIKKRYGSSSYYVSPYLKETKDKKTKKQLY